MAINPKDIEREDLMGEVERLLGEILLEVQMIRKIVEAAAREEDELADAGEELARAMRAELIPRPIRKRRDEH